MRYSSHPRLRTNDIEPADILYERTTIHANSNYDETPLSDAEVTLILNAGFSAPTGGNQRSTNFFVITDREVMRSFRPAILTASR